MAIGWDMLCGEEILKLKQKYPDIILIGAVPFMGQELMYNYQDKERYAKIYHAADHIKTIWLNGYSADAYHLRNDWMIANSCKLLAYDSGKRIRSGASSTIRKAQKAGLDVFNFYLHFETYK